MKKAGSKGSATEPGTATPGLAGVPDGITAGTAAGTAEGQTAATSEGDTDGVAAGMTAGIAAPEATAKAQATDPAAAVTAYLRDHPSFFDEHPEALTHLRILHTAAGGAVSLIERQVRVLRGQLDTERSRLAQLIARAREYESFSTRLHALVLALIAAPDLEQVRTALHEALMREFSAQAVTLALFPPAPAADDPGGAPVIDAFRDFLERRHALCGPLDEAKNTALFGAIPGDEAVRCAALVPIHAQGRTGVLAIGAADPNRFKPDMGTDLLDRLGEIVSRKLEMLPLEAPPPPAAPPAPKPARRSRAKKPTVGQ